MPTEAPIYHLEGVMKARAQEPGDFTGPLDLILHLLSKNRMEIRDIQIALILDQYMDWMNRRRELDLEVASEFVAMASQLVYLKTRMLLSLEDEETRSEMEVLMADLEARQRSESYGLIRTVVPDMADRYKVGRDCLTRPPEPIPPDRTVRYQHTGSDLLAALAAVLQRAGSKLPPPMTAFQKIVGREPYPVADKAAEVLRRLRDFGVASFRALFRGCQSRSEIVATFLAVLELCRERRIRLTGTESECTVAAEPEEVRPGA